MEVLKKFEIFDGFLEFHKFQLAATIDAELLIVVAEYLRMMSSK